MSLRVGDKVTLVHPTTGYYYPTIFTVVGLFDQAGKQMASLRSPDNPLRESAPVTDLVRHADAITRLGNIGAD